MTRAAAANDNPYDLNSYPALAKYVGRVADEAGGEIKQNNFRSIDIIGTAEDSGYPKVLAKVRLDKAGNVICPQFPPTEAEQKAILEAIARHPFPTFMPMSVAKACEIEKLVKDPATSTLLYYLDLARKKVIMVEERTPDGLGGKSFRNWTFWSDGELRVMEPEVLPLWKPEKRTKQARLMIHEGGGTAFKIDRLINGMGREADAARDAHPWIKELGLYEHRGWAGGALRPLATDWDEVKKEKWLEVILACDHDNVGIEAARIISSELRIRMKVIRFDDRFPAGFDIADKIPDGLWDEHGLYKGPSLADMTSPATWATDIAVSGKKGRPAIVCREEFAAEWYQVITPEVYIHRDDIGRHLDVNEFNRKVAPFSNAEDTSRPLIKSLLSQCDRLIYRPGIVSRGRHPHIIADEDHKGQRLVNTWRSTTVVPIKGDPGPFLEFMEYLIVNEGDRKEVLRWVATLIARPDIRMLYSLLLWSRRQGVGKSTLAKRILAPLVGEDNVSNPPAAQVVDSDFTGWAARVRLVIIDEMFSGSNRKGYNRLKEVITEPTITINEKFVKPYEIDNWLHIFASSNLEKALHIDKDDRRWLVPRVTEEKRPPEFWGSFYHWLDRDGLGVIMRWAGEFIAENGGVEPGAHAPMTSAKMEVIHASQTKGQEYAVELAELVVGLLAKEDAKEKYAVLSVNEVRDWVANRRAMERNTERPETPLTLRGALVDGGLMEPDSDAEGNKKRYKINRVMTFVVANFRIPAGEDWEAIKDFHKTPDKIWPW